MSQTKKIRVAVLFGGRSGEHEVSISSATNVIKHLDRSKFEVVPIGIDKQGSWYLGDDIARQQLAATHRLQLQRDAERMLFTPELIGRQPLMAQEFLATHLKKSDRLFDVVFPMIHGTLCEDGTVQGMLELADVPYVGCGVLSSSIGMDKDVSKRLIQGAGIHVPPFLVVKRHQWEKNPKPFCDLVTQKLTYPVFVKPANTGSSVGVQKVKTAAALADAIQAAFAYDTKVVVEQGIDAMELEVGVLESEQYGADPFVSVVGEMRPSEAHEFYTYQAKYVDENGAELLLPAKISADKHREVQELCKTIFNVLECEGMVRVDLFFERATQQIYFNEINTIPGFTNSSAFPKLIIASGVSYQDLLTRLVNVAIDRHTRRSQLSREYNGYA